MGASGTERPDQELVQLATVIAEDLALLAGIQDRELDLESIELMHELGFPLCLHFTPRGELAGEAFTVLKEAMHALRSPDTEVLDELAADYADIYLNHSIQASPLESVWLDEEGLTMQEPMFQVREWYRRFGMAAENWRVRSDDHLVLQLLFLSRLLSGSDDKYSQAERLTEAARFMDEHLLRWIEPFARRVAARCGTPLYAGVAMLTAAYLNELRDVLAELLGEPRPTAEEIEERMKPKPEAVEVPLTYMPGTAPSW